MSHSSPEASDTSDMSDMSDGFTNEDGPRPRVLYAQVARCATVRELSRKTADILQPVEDDGHTVMILRNSKPIALLVPLPDAVPRRRVRRANGQEVDLPAPPEELDDARERLLLALREGVVVADPWDGAGVPREDASLPLARLEIAGLIRRVVGGYAITRRGLDYVEWKDRVTQTQAE